MAYGVKYRLDFRDDRGYLRRVDILKNNYTGAVLDWIGTSDPITIEWASDDNFYSPIIGSTATLNMQVTDSVTYDNFFEYDEREYQIKVYFDNGAGGWNTYWVGWITNDIYSEAIRSAPYTMSIKANDGIGTIDGFNTYIPTDGSNANLWDIIVNNLNILGLDLSIKLSVNIREYLVSYGDLNPFKDADIDNRVLFSDSYSLRNAKEVLSNILSLFNCRLYQAGGYWIIANNSSYGDYRVLDYIEANPSSSLATILGVKQGYLNASSEQIKFINYNSNGTFISATNEEKLLEIKTDLQPVQNDLIQLVKRPVNKYELNISLFGSRIPQYDPSFELQTAYWTESYLPFNNSWDGEPRSGDKSFKTTSVIGVGTTQGIKLTNTTLINFPSDYLWSNNTFTDLEFIASVKYSSSSGGTFKFPYQLTQQVVSTIYYYNATSQTWQTTSVWNYFDTTETDKWLDFRASIPTLQNNVFGGGITINIGTIEFSGTLGNFNYVLIDNVGIRVKDTDLSPYKTLSATAKYSTTNKSYVMSDSNFIYNDYLRGGIFTPLWKRPQAGLLEIQNICTIQRANDFENYCKTYEGSFSAITGLGIVDMTNKLWLNFSNYQENDSAIIDNMSINLKRNQALIRFHIPTNYVDAGWTYIENFQE